MRTIVMRNSITKDKHIKKIKIREDVRKYEVKQFKKLEEKIKYEEE